MYYVPADRTGLMHTYSAVVGGLIASAPTTGLRAAAQTPVLSGLVAGFLEQLLGVDRFGRELDLGTNVELATLGRSVGMEWSPITNYPHFVCRPEGWQEDLAFTNASSKVSDVAPEVLYLRHLVSPQDALIVAEPESHMHPAMQVEFMNQLATVVKTVVKVIVTTHGEWMTRSLATSSVAQAFPTTSAKDLPLILSRSACGCSSREKRPKGSVVKEVSFDKYGYSGTGFDAVLPASQRVGKHTASRIENGSRTCRCRLWKQSSTSGSTMALRRPNS